MSVGQGIPKKLGQLKKLLIVLVMSAVVAAVLTAVLAATGLLAAVPQARLRTIDMSLAPWLVVGIVLFVHLAFVGLIYVFFAKKIVKKASQARDQWSDLPAVAKAILAGLPFAVVAALAVVATDVLATSLSVAVRLAAPLVAWLLVIAASFVHLQSTDRLADLYRRLWVGTVAGGGFAAGIILLDWFVGPVDAPGYAPLVTLFVAAPLSAGILIRSAQRDDDGYLAALLVKTGFAQVRRIKSLTVALAIGLLVGVIGALLAAVTVGGILPTLLAFLLVWGLATYGVLRWFQRTDTAHSDLVIADIRDRSSGRRRELSVANQRDERVDLRNAKIRDTEYDLYRTNIDVLLAPGQTETFDIPPDFALFPSTDNLATDLPLGFSVSKSADAPVIVTQDGKKFKLRWGEGVAEAAGYAERRPQQDPHPDADPQEDNV
ncbi:MAG: hypothetical protein V5A39_02190 [Haloarculaceae archaeon]